MREVRHRTDVPPPDGFYDEWAAVIPGAPAGYWPLHQRCLALQWHLHSLWTEVAARSGLPYGCIRRPVLSGGNIRWLARFQPDCRRETAATAATISLA